MILIYLVKKFLIELVKISEGSAWIIKSIDAKYVNVFIYNPLSGRSYIQLPLKLRNPIKGLINIKNSNNKCFLWCHIRHLTLLKIHPERITKADRKIVNGLDYADIGLPVFKNDYSRIENKNNILINVLCYENDLVYPVHISDKKI